jgi:hypothetical protein
VVYVEKLRISNDVRGAGRKGRGWGEEEEGNGKRQTYFRGDNLLPSFAVITTFILCYRAFAVPVVVLINFLD